MMSYLWILLLGSLLAGSAKAQDEVTTAEDLVVPETPGPDAVPKPEADEGSDHTAEEILPTAAEPEHAADPEPEAHEPVTPADGGAEAVTPAGAGADTEQETPASADAEAVTPEDGGAEAHTPADGNAEPGTPAADAEAEAAPTAQGPAADPEVKDPEAEEPAPDVEEQPTSGTEAPPAQEEDGPEGEAKPTAGPAVPDNAEEPTDPAADVKPTVPVDEEEVVADVGKEGGLAPTVKVDIPKPKMDSELNLEDALPEGNEVDNPSNPGKGRSFGSNAHAAEATGDADKPQAQEASSGSLAGILCAIVVAVVGAAGGYFTYQKKKLCFKDRQEADPEAARKADAGEAQSDPQVLSNLLNSS